MTITLTNLEPLLAPIPGGFKPTGEDIADEEMRGLARLSRQQPPDWDTIIARLCDWLKQRGKSLNVAERLAEALALRDGLAGLRTGLRLLRLLLDRYPRLPWGNQTIAWLRSDRHLATIPLIRIRGHSFCLDDLWERPQELQDQPRGVWQAVQDLLEDCKQDHQSNRQVLYQSVNPSQRDDLGDFLAPASMRSSPTRRSRGMPWTVRKAWPSWPTFGTTRTTTLRA